MMRNPNKPEYLQPIFLFQQDCHSARHSARHLDLYHDLDLGLDQDLGQDLGLYQDLDLEYLHHLAPNRQQLLLPQTTLEFLCMLYR
jgi:hypothetical protein